MCGQCRSISTGLDWFAAGTDGSLAGRRHARAALARASSVLLSGIGVRVVAHPGALTLTVQTATGRSRTVSRLDEIADAAATLTGRRVDPLAADVVDAVLAPRVNPVAS
ncbi:MAG: hypothetical protein QOG20_865 [Pseudonocardiales bacterium]|nr:hypothetical protein [Pseudonocardiales bacterium]